MLLAKAEESFVLSIGHRIVFDCSFSLLQHHSAAIIMMLLVVSQFIVYVAFVRKPQIVGSVVFFDLCLCLF